MKKPRIWIKRKMTSESLSLLQKNAEVFLSGELGDLTGVHGAITGSTVNVDAALMDAAGDSLVVISQGGIGFDNIDLAAANSRGIIVTYNPDAPTMSTAELAIGLMLSLARQLPCQHNALIKSGTALSISPGSQLQGRRLGIIGLGRVGSAVGRIAAQGLNMKVTAYDPYVPRDKGRDIGVKLLDDFGELIYASDVISLHVPLTDETRHMIDDAVLSRMQDDVFLINTSRGAVIDETALITHVQKGRFAGVGLDVFDPEPPTPQNPLLHCERVIATGHIGAFTDQSLSAMCMGAAEQTLQVLRGEKPKNMVNPEIWPGRIKGI